MFTLENVSKKFGTEYALRDISMTIGNGLNFIIGASGSGKTTLLKILSGMEHDFIGDVRYCDKSIKNLSEKELSYYYHNVFGFVWQDFNLLDDRTVLENVMLPQYLSAAPDKKAAMKLLGDVDISELAFQKVGKLSGGQKQRVAIARELAKNPQVLLADEPTSALDEKSAKAIMRILRSISKSRTVIIVTHDTSLIEHSASVYELDKGALIAAADGSSCQKPICAPRPHRLSLKNAFKLACGNMRCKYGRLSAAILSLLIASTLLLVTVSGAISGTGQSAFDDLFATYGQSILDLSVVDNFTSAGGTDGAENDAPSADVSQDIDGLYEKYLSDTRVSHIVFTQAFNDIKIKQDGQDYTIKTSNTMPSVNELTAGVMPMGDGHEVVVPQSFVRTLGITDEAAIGKTISFSGAVYNWDSGNPVSLPVHTEAKIVGVVDTTVKYDSGGQVFEYSVDDSFFFSKSALHEMQLQAKINSANTDFTIRAKTPAELIAIKDELNASGIVPIGRFELIEDMVRLNEQTRNQSGYATIIIAILSLVTALSVALMAALSRRREYAIHKVSGFSVRHMALLISCETLVLSTISAVLFLALSPLINLATSALWNVNILTGRLLTIGTLLLLGTGTLSGIATGLIATSTDAVKALATGEK